MALPVLYLSTWPSLDAKVMQDSSPLEFNFLSFHYENASQDDVCVYSELPVVSSPSPSPGKGVLQILQDAFCLIQFWGRKWEIWEWNGKYEIWEWNGKYRGTTVSAMATSLRKNNT